MPTAAGESSASDAEALLRGVVDICTDCDTCRFLMDDSCLLFPRLYQLWDDERETGRPISADALGALADLCTLCGLCPCPNIRSDVVRAKAARVAAQGMPLGIRALADVQRFARLGALAPNLINRLFSLPLVRRALARFLNIHPRRRLPRLAPESFFAWARRKGLDRSSESGGVAYFAGCTAGYLFPEVARAAVAVLAHNGVAVHVPEQQCCGMPTLLEGDTATTMARAGANLETLKAVAQAGGEVVCSCPTCGFLLKVLLKENACFSAAYQRSVDAGADEILVPEAGGAGEGFLRVRRSMYGKVLRDNGLFAGLEPLARIALAERVDDVGAYLLRLKTEERLKIDFRPLAGRMVYFAPCHQREQGVGSPYLELLERVPGLRLIPVGGPMDCCGMGGSLGYKRQFHEDSLRLGAPLFEKIAATEPEAIVTDCLSCRLQFQHRLAYPVFHPLEILQRAYALDPSEASC